MFFARTVGSIINKGRTDTVRILTLDVGMDPIDFYWISHTKIVFICRADGIPVLVDALEHFPTIE